ncbi:MAG: hypothetical protein MRY32_04245 [Rickettsiales bacterium]|nr:hypothetical protein [Rickettsiales bacterium]
MKGWRTVLFNILAAVMPVLETAGVDLGLEGQSLAFYGLGVAIGNIVLRFLTTTPIGTK